MGPSFPLFDQRFLMNSTQAEPQPFQNVDVAIVGGGPAGLMAAELLSSWGYAVHLFDAMPSVGRKFLLAGRGGLNLTHAEEASQFLTRYGQHQQQLTPLVQAWGAPELRNWAQSLGIDTFVGSSGRVFPMEMKAAPLLRAWLHRLRHPASGVPVQFHMRHRCLGWQGQDLVFERSADEPPLRVQARATVLALGGGSWPRLGSDGAWLAWLMQQGVAVKALKPANCGFDVQGRDGHVGWSSHLSKQFAGTPLKSVALSFTDSVGQIFNRRGEFVVTATGVEGSLVYAASALLRDEIARNGSATLHLDLKPDFTPERVLAEVSHPRGTRSLSSHLKSRLNLTALHLALLHEVLSKEAMNNPAQLAAAIKHLPITLATTRPIDEAISSAGGVRLEALDAHLMANALPGLFVAGEMLDWEAPTGGYLLSACLASGRVAGLGATRLLAKPL